MTGNRGKSTSGARLGDVAKGFGAMQVAAPSEQELAQPEDDFGAAASDAPVAGSEPVRLIVDSPDRELVLRAASGDDAAMRKLYRDHVERVFRTVVRILGRDDSDVDDVVQQTFLAALDGATRFDGRSRLSTWLIGIATRRALDQARDRWRRGRWQRVSEWVGLGRAAGRPDDLHDSRAFAEWALEKLTPDQRAVFVLHEVEGHTLAEIGAMTGTGISTLHARLVAGRKRLDALIGAVHGDVHDST